MRARYQRRVLYWRSEAHAWQIIAILEETQMCLDMMFAGALSKIPAGQRTDLRNVRSMGGNQTEIEVQFSVKDLDEENTRLRCHRRLVAQQLSGRASLFHISTWHQEPLANIAAELE